MVLKAPKKFMQPGHATKYPSKPRKKKLEKLFQDKNTHEKNT